MPINFNLGKFAENLQKAGSSMLQSGLLLTASREIGRGGLWGGSIWGMGMGMGCYGGGSIWGCYGGIMPGAPPLNISHPIYSSTYANPYLTEAGMASAAQYGRDLIDNYLAQQNQLIQGNTPGANTYNPSDVEASNQFENAMKDGKGIKFVTDAWTKLANKENPTEEEQALRDESYKQSVANLGYSHTKYLDKEYGNGDGKMALSEITSYLAEKYPDIDKSEINTYAQNILNTLDIDGNKEITGDEMTALLAYIDEKGANNKRDGEIHAEDYENINNFMHDEILSENLKANFTTIHKNLFK